MRIGRRHPWMGEVSLAALLLALAGCSSTSGQNSFTTSSLAPRPEEGMRRDAPRLSTAESEAPRPYTQLGYTPPPPDQRGSGYQPYGQQGTPYSRPYPYGTQTAAYGTPPPAAPYAQQPYGQPPRPQQYSQVPYAQPQYPQASSLTTASVGGQPPYGQPGPQQPMNQQVPPAQAPTAYAPLTTGSLPRETPTPLSNQGVYLVREGDTLYGISKRTGTPVGDLISANKIQNNKISIGQQLTIPQKHAAK